MKSKVSNDGNERRFCSLMKKHTFSYRAFSLISTRITYHPRIRTRNPPSSSFFVHATAAFVENSQSVKGGVLIQSGTVTLCFETKDIKKGKCS